MSVNTYYCDEDPQMVDWWLRQKEKQVARMLPGSELVVEHKSCLVATVRHANHQTEHYPVVLEPGEIELQAIMRFKREFPLTGGVIVSDNFPAGHAIFLRAG